MYSDLTEDIVKRTATKKSFSDDGLLRTKRSSPKQLVPINREAVSISRLEGSGPNPDQLALEQPDLKRFKELPKELGAVLVAAGIVGIVLPGPGTPALIAGGLALWPAAFGKLELWLERRYPGIHRRSMKQIGRFLDDLEKRYPYSPQDKKTT
jgi:hypothetical protein